MNDCLPDIRCALLDLHKTLVVSERVGYEQILGPIRSPNHFLQLLTGDPWFAWLHPLSQLIVAMDEVLDAREPLPSGTREGLLGQARHLLVPSEEGQGFSRHYFDALQRDPEVVLAHAKAVKLVNPHRRPGTC